MTKFQRPKAARATPVTRIVKHMTKQSWKNVLNRLDIVTSGGDIVPVQKQALDAFEKKTGIRLPSSYRSYCGVFGAGQIANTVSIAVPGFDGASETYSLEHLTQSQVDLAEQYAELGVDLAQCIRGLFFAFDIIGSIHFFDPEDVTDEKRKEYAVYTLFRDFEVQRTADNFGEFVTECCLGDAQDKLFADAEPPEPIFRPVK